MHVLTGVLRNEYRRMRQRERPFAVGCRHRSAQSEPVVFHQEIVRKPDVYIEAFVTGYNTVPPQTDGTPCIGAAGTYICGRNDVVACPPLLKLGTAVEIGGKRYVCEDRTSRKYRGRFDINCDQDKSCPFKVASWTTVKVLFE